MNASIWVIVNCLDVDCLSSLVSKPTKAGLRTNHNRTIERNGESIQRDA